jgi:hypothetical protein
MVVNKEKHYKQSMNIMKANYTKGEWSYSRYSHDFGVYSPESNGRDIALVREYGDEQQALANAKLIAAAPHLLDAAQSVLNILEAMKQDDRVKGMRMVLEEAIRKAT